MNLPEAISYQEDYRTEYKYVTPYSNHERSMKTIQERGIKIPFEKVITRADGLSVCSFCNSRYSGDQGKCSNIVQWHYSEDSYHAKKVKRIVHVGEIYGEKGEWSASRHKVKSVHEDKCGELTKWDLDDAFRKQQEFFDFVSLIESVTIDFPNLLQKFGHLIPPGSLNEYRVKFLEQKSEQHDIQFQSIKHALEMIAQKMNAAGHHLSF